ncbi:hypothetical protein ACFLU4_01900 [Chloroflexota bacterium]
MMRPKGIRDVLNRLSNVKTAGDGKWTADCPVPGHKTPRYHLSIRDVGDKALVQCFGNHNHDYRAVCENLGLDTLIYGSNSHKPKTTPEKRLADTFSYEYEKGKEAYQIRRYDLGNRDKTFEAWHWNGSTYVKGMGDYKDKPILYHLPEISEWIAVGKRIYLPEGELKVDCIISRGGAASTSPFGAGRNKWQPQYSKALAGAEIIVLPDNDKPGGDFAYDKAASLYGIVRSIKVLALLGLLEKGDIIDWFNTGGTFEELEQLASQCPDYEPPSDTTLPEIVVTDRHLRDQTADALEALYKANKPECIFRRSGALTRISLDEKQRPYTEALGESAFRGCLARSCNFVRINVRGDRIAVPPPLDVVRDCLSLGEWQFPALLGITEAPVIRPDGTVMNKPGYDRATNLYYYPSAKLTVPPIPDKPSDSDIKAAIELALEPLADFPFDTEASQANAMATMFTPILRPMMDGPVPLALFDKPQQGTGASLLAEVISLIATGRAAAMMTAQKDDEGWRKTITSLLLKGQLIVTIDNILYELWAPSLAAILTATTYQDRILGRSEMVILPNRTTWLATGNNIRLRGDLPRRCIWVRMDALMARPWLRDQSDFKHPQLIEWVSEHRGAILAAILTVARAWVVAGMPEAQGLPNLGGYESYCRVVGGVMAYMDVSGFLANLDAMYNETDTETPKWESFLETWHDVLGDKAVTTAELISHINDNVELHSTLPDTIADTDARNYTRRLGNALAKKKGVRFPHGFSVTKAGEHRRAATWQVLSPITTDSHQCSFKCESGESDITPAHGNINKANDKYLYKDRAQQDSPDSRVALKKCESGQGDSTGELPDCPACGRNEWTYSPDGDLLCPCGHKQGGDQ